MINKIFLSKHRLPMGLAGGILLAPQFAIGSGLALEEIVITAQKKEESLQKAPISIAVFGTESLENKGINTLVDLQTNVPNLQITPHPNSASTARIFMRGVGNIDDQITQDPSVAVYLDGVYMARSQGLAMEVGEVERIEVLRGPQGSLYGRNATGGAVNFVTVRPVLDEVEFKQTLTIANRDQLRSKTSFNAPLNDNMALKLSYLNASKEGVVDNLGSGEDRFGDQEREAYRVDWFWEASDHIELRYTYDRSDIDDTPAYIQAAPLHPDRVERAGRGHIAVSGLDNNDISSSGHSLSVSWDVNESMTLRSITAYRELQNQTYQDYLTGTFGPFPLFITRTDSAQKQFTQELQLLGNAAGDEIEYIAGLYYFSEQGDSDDSTAVPSRGVLSLRNVETENRAYALFGQATYTPQVLDNRLHFTLGARWSRDEREAELFTETELTGLNLTLPGETGAGNNDFSNFSTSFVVAYDLAFDINLYAKFVKGYKTGGFNVRASSIDAFEAGFSPEELVSYEVGAKTTLWDNRLRLNVALFQADYDDIQINVQSDPSDITITDVLNAGKAKISGVELEATAILTESLSANLSYGYVDADYEEIVDVRGQDIASGFRFVENPAHSYTLDIDYVFPAMAIGELVATVGYSWQGEKYSSTDITSGKFITDNYGLLNARLSLSEIALPQGELRVALWGRNLEDEEYYIAHFDAGANSAMFGEPRSYGIDVVYEY